MQLFDELDEISFNIGRVHVVVLCRIEGAWSAKFEVGSSIYRCLGSADNP